MNDLNSFIAVGRLTREPELRTIKSGTSTCKFGLAVNRSYRNTEGEQVETPLFINIVTWGKQAENCSNYIHKGSKIAIQGSLTMSMWTDDNGVKKTNYEINAQMVQFLDSKPKVEKEEVIEEIKEKEETPW